uniref:Uncharacterized protein n=1 Tax=Romanomermis culicivorax TaxID=13658 RepID=A0A915IDA0_ROMCU
MAFDSSELLSPKTSECLDMRLECIIKAFVAIYKRFSIIRPSFAANSLPISFRSFRKRLICMITLLMCELLSSNIGISNRRSASPEFSRILQSHRLRFWPIVDRNSSPVAEIQIFQRNFHKFVEKTGTILKFVPQGIDGIGTYRNFVEAIV